jgi:hypothetical protein
MAACYIRYAAEDTRVTAILPRARARSIIYLAQGVCVVQQSFTLLFYLRKSVIRIIVIHNHPHDIEQRGRVNTFATCMPRRQLMTDITPRPI